MRLIMFNYAVSSERKSDFTLSFFYMTYITMVILSIVLFSQIVSISIFGHNITLSGSVIPYVFLYPISFIVLRVYGLKKVNHMIGSMLLAVLVFILIAKITIAASTNKTEIYNILSNSFKMYLAGFIGMPAGVYSSFITINLLNRLGLSFNVISLTIATAIGEIINTVVVFPIGFYGKYSLSVIFSKIIVGALIFKFTMGAILAVCAVAVINLILNKSITSA